MDRGKNARLHIGRVNKHLKWVLTYDMCVMTGLRLAICPASLSFTEACDRARTLFDIEGRILIQGAPKAEVRSDRK